MVYRREWDRRAGLTLRILTGLAGLDHRHHVGMRQLGHRLGLPYQPAREPGRAPPNRRSRACRSSPEIATLAAMDPDRDAIQARCEALLGQVLGGRYRLDAVLGMGAMGAVFRARHTGLERDVALKLLHEDMMASEEMRARFAREAAAISKLDHPNCVRISDFGSDDDHQYLVMELLQGESLSQRVDEDPLPSLPALEIADDVLAGLEHAHGHGLVHRDIKPDNVFMVHEEGGRARAKLLDFGIVKLQEQEGARPLTKLGMIFGTPCYMSPEQATGATVDARTDLYSVGILLYYMLAGRLPFDSDDPLKVLRQQIREPPPPLPAEVPGPVRELVERLLAKKPEDRYPSASAAREAVTQLRKRLEGPATARSMSSLGAEGVALPVEVQAPAPASPAPAASAAAAPAPPTPPVPAGPAIVVPSHSRPRWPPPWWPPGLDVRWVAGGLGVLVLLVIIVVATSGEDEAPEAPPPDAAANAAQAELEKLLGGKAPLNTSKKGSAEGDDEAADDGAGDPEPDADTKTAAPTLQANLMAVDALLEARKYDSAHIILGPLLEAYPNEAQLHWRMARVLTTLGGADNRTAAFESFATAISADATLLDDEAFMASLWGLMDDPKLRTDAVDLALELLGSRANERLSRWLNTQAAPLAHATRHRIIAHLQQQGGSEGINRPLQRALDLWQAGSSEDPCKTFAGALQEASEDPDSFLVGTLRSVGVPKAAAAEGEEPQPCPGVAEQLAEVRARHVEMFVGIDPVVPKAYRKRPAGKSGQTSRTQRRR
jgi:hypothetical protein